jgi:ferredoxin
MLRIAVDQTKCCGAGSCAQTAPEVFAQRDEDGLVVLLDPQPPAALREAVEDAVLICPTSVITVEEV